MILTCILEIYLKFKGRKGWKLNHFRFWNIKKWERQDKGITRLGDEKWPLWSKKEGKKTWEMRLEVRFSKLYGNLELKIWWQHVLWIWGKIWSIFQILFCTYYISFWSLGSQESVSSNRVQIRAKMKLWPFEYNYTKLKGHFKMILKSNLWIWNPILNDHSFKFTHCHFDVHILYLNKCF